jgi:hypothetical protein
VLVRPYGVLPTEPGAGIIEVLISVLFLSAFSWAFSLLLFFLCSKFGLQVVPDAISLDDLAAKL